MHFITNCGTTTATTTTRPWSEWRDFPITLKSPALHKLHVACRLIEHENSTMFATPLRQIACSYSRKRFSDCKIAVHPIAPWRLTRPRVFSGQQVKAYRNLQIHSWSAIWCHTQVVHAIEIMKPRARPDHVSTRCEVDTSEHVVPGADVSRSLDAELWGLRQLATEIRR